MRPPVALTQPYTLNTYGVYCTRLHCIASITFVCHNIELFYLEIDVNIKVV